MIELIGTAAGGAALLVAVGDYLHDRGPWKVAETLRVLSRNMVAGITQVRQGDTKRLDAWLKEHAGTTDVTTGDSEFFELQLELVRRELD